MRPTLSSRRRTGILYAGVTIFAILAALTAQSIWTAWQQRSGEARAEAVFELVEQRMPTRPTDAPGAMAWLRLELVQFGQHINDQERASHYRSFAAATDRVPDELQGALGALRRGVSSPTSGAIAAIASTNPPADDSLRRQRLVAHDGATFVVTRRRALDVPDLAAASASNHFIASAVRVLAGAGREVARELQARPLATTPSRQPPRPVRLYAVSEDGTLVSAPWDNRGTDAHAVDRELALLGARPGLPAFAPEEFFFRFSPGDSRTQAAYSGFYLDVGGRGLVSTITMPLSAGDGEHGVLALDLTFDVDWRAFAAAVESPVAGAAVTTADASRASWSTLAAALDADAPSSLRTAIDALAAEERRSGAAEPPSPLRHGLVGDAGAVAAFQVSDRTWLLMLFPRTSPAFPVAAVALLAGVLMLLLAGFEFHRRRAEDERANAERALEEKQNLLNTMQIPLVVVDPNTDSIVSSNLAAESIGIRGGSRFADLVWPDARARAHYEKMQVATPEPRRAYGVPVGVRNEAGALVERYAIIRSVAVTAPIAALKADERHRLGVLFLLEPDADLALLVNAIDERAHRDERRRLAGLLSHGVDTLARVLEHCLTRPDQTPGAREFAAWLADYLERRLTVTAWLLDHWDAAPPLPRDSLIGVDQARATFARLTSVFALVRDDRDLRSRLHWDNGTLAAVSPDGRVVDVELDWPDVFEFTTPVRGGFGLFLGEVLANAVRHGTPGSTPQVSVTCDRIRKELTFVVLNHTGAAARGVTGETYGGVEILRAMARLFEWPGLVFEAESGRFRVQWRIPVSDRGFPGHAD
jgi:hypothetical protein